MLKSGKIDEATFNRLEDCAGPTCGSCSFLGTANTMCCVAEAMGMLLPGSGTIPATHADRLAGGSVVGPYDSQVGGRGHYGPSHHKR